MPTAFRTTTRVRFAWLIFDAVEAEVLIMLPDDTTEDEAIACKRAALEVGDRYRNRPLTAGACLPELRRGERRYDDAAETADLILSTLRHLFPPSIYVAGWLDNA